MIDYNLVVSQIKNAAPLEEILTCMGFKDCRRILGNGRLICTHDSYLGNSGKHTHRRTETGWLLWLTTFAFEKLATIQGAIK